MSGKPIQPKINQNQYKNIFTQVLTDCTRAPSQLRQCQDICCLVVFILITITFLTTGIYFIASTAHTNNSTTSSANQLTIINLPTHTSTSPPPNLTGIDSLTQFQFSKFTTSIPYIILMSGLSLFLSIFIILIAFKWPQLIIYGTVLFTGALVITTIVLVITQGNNNWSDIVFKAGLLFWFVIVAIILCFFVAESREIASLLKVSVGFVKIKPSILLAPLITIGLAVLLIAFWVESFIGIQRNRYENALDHGVNNGFDIWDAFSIIWGLFIAFYTYFLYYTMVYLVAMGTSMWYYGNSQNFIIKGISSLVKSNLGSITFASLIVNFCKLLQFGTNDYTRQRYSQKDESCAYNCHLIIQCCFSSIEHIIRVLNRNSVITMSITGKGLIESSKATIYMIYKSFGIFIRIEYLDVVSSICVWVMVVALPTMGGYYLLKTTSIESIEEETMYLYVGSLAIFTVSLMISLLVRTVISQILSCLLILSCLHKCMGTSIIRQSDEHPVEFRHIHQEIQKQKNQYK